MALMHAVANVRPSTEFSNVQMQIKHLQTDVRFTPSSPLATFFGSPACQAPSTPNNGITRAEVFSSTPAFAEIHASMCNAGQSAPASADEHPDGAYVCFVKHDARVIELDGGRPGAIDRGPCNDLLEVCQVVQCNVEPS